MKARDVAEWFHERDGELFEIDETPFSKQELSKVLDDSIDPVQLVMVDGVRYVGVIEFKEHNGWYEYTRWDDYRGEVNIGVCARCVEVYDKVSEVAYTIGDDTETARQKFDEHYVEAHDKKQEDIKTGATLLSGSTVNGNALITPANDGSGSNVDADFLRGGVVLKSNMGLAYEPQEIAGEYRISRI